MFIDQWLGKYCILGSNWAKVRWATEVLAKKYGLSQIQLRGLGLVATPGKFRSFSPLLSLEIAVSALILTQNCYFKYEHFFLLKNGNLTINWVPPLSSTNILCLKDYPHNLTKWNQWDFKNPCFSGLLLLKRDSNTGAFLWILRNL